MNGEVAHRDDGPRVDARVHEVQRHAEAVRPAFEQRPLHHVHAAVGRQHPHVGVEDALPRGLEQRPPHQPPARERDRVGGQAAHEVDGDRIVVVRDAAAGDGVAPGEAVAILLRPENFDLLAEGQTPGPRAAAIEARLEQELFLGTDYHLIVRTEPGDKTLKVTVRDAHRESLSNIAPGARLRLQYPRHRLHPLRG